MVGGVVGVSAHGGGSEEGGGAFAESRAPKIQKIGQACLGCRCWLGSDRKAIFSRPINSGNLVPLPQIRCKTVNLERLGSDLNLRNRHVSENNPPFNVLRTDPMSLKPIDHTACFESRVEVGTVPDLGGRHTQLSPGAGQFDFPRDMYHVVQPSTRVRSS